MDLDKLINLFSDHRCNIIYVKSLSENDNSKNQVYIGGSFDVLNIFPLGDIHPDDGGNYKRTRFKSDVNFSWLDPEGNEYPAPNAQFIMYPRYPEVRFSGFLKRCSNAPSELMANRIPGRILFLGVTENLKVLGYVSSPDDPLTLEFNRISEDLEWEGLFRKITIVNRRLEKNSRILLLRELQRIHSAGWITSKRLDSFGKIVDCKSPNCGGYTLEAELGIRPNSYSRPDYLGWELKSFKVANFERIHSAIITLMTPEPTGGWYKEEGVKEFVLKYGYKDMKGREDRMNFGGIHRAGKLHPLTNLTLIIKGYDSRTGKITDSRGYIGLVEDNDEIAASWEFSSLLKHWNQKHAKASYIPSIMRKSPEQQYYYGNNIILGFEADFSLFLLLMARGDIYYDPGIKLEKVSTPNPKSKRRSQFRIKSRNLPDLYRKNEVIDLNDDIVFEER